MFFVPDKHQTFGHTMWAVKMLYSGKLSREKTFEDLGPFVNACFVNITCAHSRNFVYGMNTYAKLFPVKSLYSSFRKSFLPQKCCAIQILSMTIMCTSLYLLTQWVYIPMAIMALCMSWSEIVLTSLSVVSKHTRVQDPLCYFCIQIRTIGYVHIIHVDIDSCQFTWNSASLCAYIQDG